MPDQSENQDEHLQINRSFGEYLKEERLKQGISLETVSEKTNINIHYLIALEVSDRRKLPADVFNRGFIKIYAGLLRLDPQEALDSYEREWGFSNGIDGANTYLNHASMAEPVSLLKDNQTLAFLGIVILVAALFLAYHFSLPIFPQKNKNPATPTTIQKHYPPQTKSAQTPKTTPELRTLPFEYAEGVEQENIDHEELYTTFEKPLNYAHETRNNTSPDNSVPLDKILQMSIANSASEITQEPDRRKKSAEHRYILKANFSERTWLKIVTDKNAPAEYTFRAKEQHTWEANATISLLIGNAGGLQLTLNGKPVDIDNSSGKVIKLTIP